MLTRGIIVVLGCIIMLSACSTSSATAIMPSATPTFLPTAPPQTPVTTAPPVVTGALDPVPTNCPVRPPPQTQVYPTFGGGFSGTVTLRGSGPLWYALGIGDDLRLSLGDQLGDPQHPGTKIMWIQGPQLTPNVSLQGWELSDHTPIWIQRFDIDSGAATTAHLPYNSGNRGVTTTPDGKLWYVWGLGMYFIKAGCYDIQASWPGGQWDMVLAVGR